MPHTYKTETYNEVLCWTADTRIRYVANPKRGKSFIRYAKYEKAKTVGEALDQGSYPQDLLFDFEHGYISVLNGPRRKKPLLPKDETDSWTRTDRTLAKMHQQWLTWTKTFDLAEKLGVDRSQLTSDKGCAESTEMRCGRLQANEMAKLIFADVKDTGRKVSDRDVLAVLRLWAFKPNETRQNVMKDGVNFVFSDTLGLLAGYDGSVCVTCSTTLYPVVSQLLCRWLEDSLPADMRHKFGCTSINVNSGYAAKIHRDANNVGPSMIKAFGKFTGGELNYWAEDNKAAHVESVVKENKDTINIQKNLLLFDGNRAHSVEDFEGERFSLVFFTTRQYQKSSKEVRKCLENCGFTFPSDKILSYYTDLLSPPLGYGPKAAAPSSRGGQRTTSRSWRQPDVMLKRPSSKSSSKDFLGKEMLNRVHKLAFEKTREDFKTEITDTTFVDSKIQYYLASGGRRGVRVLLVGTSGQSVLVIDTAEDKKGSGRYTYEKLPTFTRGPPLHTTRLAEVRDWIGKIVKSDGAGEAGIKRCIKSRGDLDEPSKSKPPAKKARLAATAGA